MDVVGTSAAREPRVAVYVDYVFWCAGAGVGADRAFTIFLAELARRLGALTVVGRHDPDGGSARYALPAEARFVPLPPYARFDDVGGVLRRLLPALRAFWRALDAVDVVWILGPHGLAVPFAALALARRRRLVLGVRQDLRAYVRHRHPGRKGAATAAAALDAAFRLAGRRVPVVAVGSTLARRYGSGRVLDLTVSLVREAMLGEGRPGTGTVTRVVSVGRLEPEKNPLLLADVLAELGPPWELDVYGEGPMAADLRRRLADAGVEGAARLWGYVSFDALLPRLRDAGAMLHVSWTEGFPQVLLEAFAAGVPVVATDVGGIRAGTAGAALVVGPGDARAAAAALRRLAGDAALREDLVRRGRALAAEHTLEREAERLRAFLLSAGRAPRGR